MDIKLINNFRKLFILSMTKYTWQMDGVKTPDKWME